MRKRYSGPASRPFWNAVNSVRGKKGVRLHHWSIALQNIEELVFDEFARVVKKEKSVKP